MIVDSDICRPFDTWWLGTVKSDNHKGRDEKTGSLDLGSLVRLIWTEMLQKRPLIFKDGVAVRAPQFVHVMSMT